MSGWHVIRCVVGVGEAGPLLDKLARDKGLWSFYVQKSRHAVADYSRRRPRIVESIESDEVVVLVSDERLDEIFAFCRDELRITDPGRGTIYVSRAAKAVEIGVPAQEM